jgi:hypothetical protein
MLVLNDRVRITFLRKRAFLVAWTVCRLMAEKPEFHELGGVPAADLVTHCRVEGVQLSVARLNTPWHDEIEFKRNHELVSKLFDVVDLKDKRKPTRVAPSHIADRLQLIFCKTKPRTRSDLHGSVKLFSVSADPEQLYLYRTLAEAAAEGIQASGISELTKFRKDYDELGFLDWRDEVAVDERGDATPVVSVRLVNLSPVPMLYHTLPLSSDTEEEARDRQLGAYTKNGKELDTEFMFGETGERKIIEFLLTFPTPVKPGGTCSFKFSYHTRKACTPSKSYFMWYFHHYQARYSRGHSSCLKQVLIRIADKHHRPLTRP